VLVLVSATDLLGAGAMDLLDVGDGFVCWSMVSFSPTSFTYAWVLTEGGMSGCSCGMVLVLGLSNITFYCLYTFVLYCLVWFRFGFLDLVLP
jgi:hypothetical protein